MHRIEPRQAPADELRHAVVPSEIGVSQHKAAEHEEEVDQHVQSTNDRALLQCRVDPAEMKERYAESRQSAKRVQRNISPLAELIRHSHRASLRLPRLGLMYPGISGQAFAPPT